MQQRTTVLNSEDLLVCPTCHTPLVIDTFGATCESCSAAFRRHPDGFLDLRVDDSRYEDWLSTSEEASTRWLNEGALVEASGSKHVVQNYLVPLLRSLKLENGATVLSAGCGGGWDLETLHDGGFLAWGIDNGGRVKVWKDRTCLDFLNLGDALHLPFPDEAFDFVLSEGVIEHIGYSGDSPQKNPDWQSQRERFARSLVRVTRPSGYILVTCPNRHFPIDFFHGGRMFHGFSLRPHSPREPFLLSFGDIKRLFVPHSQWIRALTLKRFFNLDRLADGGHLATFLVAAMNVLFDLMPDSFWGTALSPYLVILVKKTMEP